MPTVTIRLTEEQREAYRRAAGAVPFERWARAALDRAARIDQTIERNAPVLEKLEASDGLCAPHDEAQVETRLLPSDAGSVALRPPPVAERETPVRSQRVKAGKRVCRGHPPLPPQADCRLCRTGRWAHLD